MGYTDLEILSSYIPHGQIVILCISKDFLFSRDYLRFMLIIRFVI